MVILTKLLATELLPEANQYSRPLPPRSRSFVSATNVGPADVDLPEVYVQSSHARSQHHSIKLRPGYALNNLGDAMVQWSGGALKNSMHRDATPLGKQAAVERYNLAYLIKPTGDRNGEAGGGVEWCAREWKRMRAGRLLMGGIGLRSFR